MNIFQRMLQREPDESDLLFAQLRDHPQPGSLEYKMIGMRFIFSGYSVTEEEMLDALVTANYDVKKAAQLLKDAPRGKVSEYLARQ